MNTWKQRGTALVAVAALLALALSWGYAQTSAPKGKININTATAAELEALPRVGPKVAQRIIDYRTQHGNFKRVEEIMKVQGIGEKVFGELRDLITVGTEVAAK